MTSCTGRAVAWTLAATIALGLALTTTTTTADDGNPAAACLPEETCLDLRIEDGKIAGATQTVRVHQGDKVRLRWTSDRRMELHLHGYNLTTEVTPGMVAITSLEAYATGRFAVEGHGHGGEEVQGVIVYLEVYPK